MKQFADIGKEKIQCLLLLAVFQITLINSKFCLESNRTVRYVSSCPVTYEKWTERARMKNCEGVVQTCTSPKNFQYHCVMNTFLNATLEVCAPVRPLMGYCAEYNLRGATLQHNFNADCTRFNKKCTLMYYSSDGYKYPECFKLKNNYIKSTSLSQRTISPALTLILTTKEQIQPITNKKEEFKQSNDIDNIPNSTQIMLTHEAIPTSKGLEDVSLLCFLIAFLLMLITAAIVGIKMHNKTTRGKRKGSVSKEANDGEKLVGKRKGSVSNEENDDEISVEE